MICSLKPEYVPLSCVSLYAFRGPGYHTHALLYVGLSFMNNVDHIPIPGDR